MKTTPVFQAPLPLTQAFILGFVIMMAAATAGAQPITLTAAQHDKVLHSLELDACEAVAVDVPNDLPDMLILDVERRGSWHTLFLEKISHRSPDFKLIVYRDGEHVEVDPGPVRTYQGVDLTTPGTRVAAVLCENGLTATVLNDAGDAWNIEPGAPVLQGARSTHIVFEEVDRVPLEGVCGVPDNLDGSQLLIDPIPDVPDLTDDDMLQPAEASDDSPSDAPQSGEVSLAVTTTCSYKLASLIIDADNYFYNSFGSISAVQNRVDVMLAQTQLWFGRDAMIQYVLNSLVVRETPFYSYRLNNNGPSLGEIRNKWQSGAAGNPAADLVHLVSTRNISGAIGVAYVGGICGSYKYGWSRNASYVMAHELGHNWGLGHCNGKPGCAGSLMCGGCGGARDWFFDEDIIHLKNSNRGCVSTTNEVTYTQNVHPIALDDRYSYNTVLTLAAAAPLTLDVGVNDHDGNCDEWFIISADEVTARGGTVQILPDSGPGGRDQLLYDPPVDLFAGEDSFDYVISDPSRQTNRATVVVSVQNSAARDHRPADQAVVLSLDTDLSWDAHASILAYDVYLGSSYAAVANATPASPEYQGRQTSKTFDPGLLTANSVYFWRIDADWGDGIVISGDVLKFYTEPSEASLAQNLLVYWSFDDGSGSTANDASGNGNHGTLFGGPLWTNDGVLGGALNFDGSNDQVELRPFSGPLGQYTVSLWVKATALGQSEWSGIFSNSSSGGGADFQFDVNGNNPGQYRYHGSTGKTIGPVTTEWVHLALTCDGSTTRLYYNGTFATSINEVRGEFDALRVGANRGNNIRFQGLIDEVRVYDRVLNPAEVGALYNLGCDELLLLHWAFDEGTGTLVGDQSGNGNDGTIIFGPRWATGGIAGGALQFDGARGHVELDPFGGGLNAYTVSLWARATALGQAQYSSLFSNASNADGGDFQIDVNGQNPGSYRYRGETNLLLGPVTTSDWVHIAVSSNGLATTTYFNGQPVETLSEVSGDFDAIRVGINRTATNRFRGLIDEVRLYNCGLRGERIQKLYLEPGGGNEQPPAAPTGLRATYDAGVVTLDWADNGEPDFASYNIYRTTTPGANYTQIASDVTQSYYFDDTSPDPTAEFYVVTAVDTNQLESTYSEEINICPFTGRPTVRLDCNRNGILDVCEIVDGSLNDCNANELADQCEAIQAGDFDNNGVVDAADFSALAAELAGPGITPNGIPGCVGMYMNAFDYDADSNFDMHDVAAFQAAVNGGAG